MVTPLIYTTCDQIYYDQHAYAFRKSAEKFGHEVKIDIVDKSDPNLNPPTAESRIYYCAARFTRLPELLDHHPNILIVDVDSVFNSHIEIDEKYDLGIFFRPWVPDGLDSLKVLCAASYWTARAKTFAESVREKIYRKHNKWMFDQKAVWQTFNEIGQEFNILRLDRKFLNYDFESEAPIWTGKGDRKHLPVYLERKAMYEAA